MHIADPPADRPKGWDLADAEREGWTGDDVLRAIDAPPPFDDVDFAPVEPEPTAVGEYRALGHDRGRFYFFSAAGGQVRDFSARDLQSVGSLCEIAPLRYWETNWPGKGESGFSIRGAGDALVRACYNAGVYDPERLRDRGAWLDDGRAVLHLGNCLLVDGVRMGLAEIESRYIYEQGRLLDVTFGEPLSAARASRLMDLCMCCPWEDTGSMGRLLAGWLVIAPICGAMPWRPHLWITGEAGSGKTWIYDSIIRPVLGLIALEVQGKTTEAGVRGDLGLDARPVVFDEFETQNEADRSRVQHVLDLARQASSEDGAAIVKGTQTGGSRRYRIRSCFAFMSINLGLQQAADESRTVTLGVSPLADKTAREAAFQELLALHKEVITPDFRPALMARTLRLLPVIRANAEVFASAIARAGYARRTGDTVGVLLAGAWSLRSSAIATTDEADALVKVHDWVRTAVTRSETDPDWKRALNFLVQIPLRVVPANGKTEDVPIGELIEAATNTRDSSISKDDALMTLTRAGIKIDYEENDPFVFVLRPSETLRKAFASSPWAASCICSTPV